jgi:DNA topoisomerase III
MDCPAITKWDEIMTALYLCEKPSQARDIARVLGATQRKDGYSDGDGVMVTWCFGHLLEMAAPDDYDPELKKWQLATLPIIPQQWIWKVRKDAKQQYHTIIGLFKKVSAVVIATDADREGEAIAREVMEMGGWHGPVSRLWLSALDDKSIRKALANQLPGEKTEALYHAAAARSKADWLVGMTLSRLYTLSAQQAGHEGVMSVGRVQTPTLNLVVDRDRMIEHFKPVPYFDVIASIATEKGEPFFAKWQVPEPFADEEGRCLSQTSAQTVVDRCRGNTGTVVNAETKRFKESPPLPYALSTLQQEASKRYGMGAQQVLDCAQALYETHKITTYPRTDCSYLPITQLETAETIIRMLKGRDEYRELVQQADLKLQSKAWNDKKITAHHAIIPTGSPVSKALSKPEQQLFDLIVRRYLAQFYPAFEYDQTKLAIAVGEDRFTATGRHIVVQGWKTVISMGDSEQGKEANLPPVNNNDRLTVTGCRVDAKKTQPPARYTEGTLIQTMKNIGRMVDDPVLKKRLKETSGIGTEATRASIIEVLLKRGFIKKQGKKHLVSTEPARALIDALPEPVKDPATTAVWEQALEEIAQGNGNADRFVSDQANMITRLTEQVKQNLASTFKQAEASQQNATVHHCPECQHPLVRRKGKSGFFWGCRNYPECKITFPDNKGRPGKPGVKAQSTGQRCPECEQGMLVKRQIRKGKNANKTFLGCSRYPDCKHTEG